MLKISATTIAIPFLADLVEFGLISPTNGFICLTSPNLFSRPDGPSSPDASEISSSAFISAFDFSCGMEQSAYALSALSLHVLK